MLLALAPMAVCATGGALQASERTNRPVVDEIDVIGPVDPLMARYAKRGISDAARDHASAVLVRLDTPGGLDSSMRSIIKAVLASRVPVLCWVGPSGARAASAGTFILLGCPVAAMAPGTNVGAAHPVGITGGVLSEKVTNDAAAYIRSLAQRYGRNADWAERAVRNSISASANEAVRLQVVDRLASSRAALLAGAGYEGARIVHLHPTVIESLLHGLVDPNWAFIFFLVGLAGLVSFVLHPGVHVIGLVGLILFVVSLISFGMLPVTLAGLLLLLASIVFFVVALKIHGRGLPEVAAITCLVLGGLFLFDPSVPNARVSRPLIAVVAIGLTAFFTLAMRAVLRARFTPVRTGSHIVVGAEGVVVRELAPSGVVRVRGETWTAESPGEPVPAGAKVKVVAVRGLTLEVVPETAEQTTEVG